MRRAACYRVGVILLAWAAWAAGATIYVDDNASGDPGPGDPQISSPDEDGSNARPFDAIQEAIDAAEGGDTVLVRDGTYSGPENRDIDFQGKAITLKSENGPGACIVDCQGNSAQPHWVFYFHSGETRASVLDGFTITGGYGTTAFPNGGGICCDYASSPTIINNDITGNHSSGDGGGIFCWGGSSPMIADNNISDNYSNYHGGGIGCQNASPVITNNTISGNYGVYGGGIFSCYCPLALTGNLITNNHSLARGGGIYSDDDSGVIANNVFSGNSTDGRGGGIYCEDGSSPLIVNNTSVYNTGGSDGGGGICCWRDCSPAVTNCIVWGNAPEQVSLRYSSSPTITYCDVQGGWPGVGNISSDPLFASGEDLSLLPGSPCIDAGDNSAVPGDLATDLNGNPRIQGTAVDMGACETPVMEATVDLDPDTLNLRSGEKWVTCYIELPSGLDVWGIDGASVTLQGIPAHIGPEGWARAGGNSGNIMDADKDGVAERMVKFPRAAVQAIATPGPMALTVCGQLTSGLQFVGTATIKVIP